MIQATDIKGGEWTATSRGKLKRSFGGALGHEPPQSAVRAGRFVEAPRLLCAERVVGGEAVGMALKGDHPVRRPDLCGAGSGSGQPKRLQVGEDGGWERSGRGRPTHGGSPRLLPSRLSAAGGGGARVVAESVAGSEAPEHEHVPHAGADAEDRHRHRRPKGEPSAVGGVVGRAHAELDHLLGPSETYLLPAASSCVKGG